MKTKANGIEVSYRIAGERGPWVVFSHSLACNLRMWDEQVDALADRHRILCIDTRGHGDSSAPRGAYTLDLLADDLKATLAALNVAQPHFVGLSMGGMIGMTFALRYPGMLRSLVLCDTASRFPPEVKPVWEERIRTAGEQGMAPLVEPTLARWFTEPFRRSKPEALERVAAMIRATPPDGYIGCCHAIPKIDLLDRLGEIACPVQIIVGEQDVGTPVAMSEAMHRAIPGSELVVIPNASHLSNLEQPDAFNAALTRFLSAH